MSEFPSARAFRAMGLYPFPLIDAQPNDPDTGKKPRFDDWQPLAICATDEQAAAWDRNNWNLGLSLGPSRLVVLDSDTPAADEWAAESLPQTPWITRTAKGHHRFYRLKDEEQAPSNKVRVLSCGLDRKANGGYVVAPGSVHWTGVIYEPLGDWTTPIHELPVYDARWFPEPKRIMRPAPQAIQRGDGPVRRAIAYLRNVPPAIQGAGGDAHTYRVACILVRDFDLSEGDALAAMMDWNQTCSPPWDADDLEAKLRNAARYGTGGFGSKNVEAPRPSGLRWA